MTSLPIHLPKQHIKTRDLLILVFILIPAFLISLGLRPLSVPDEGRYPEVAREMLLTGDFVTPKVNGIVFLDKPALYYWLEAGAMHMFGVNPWSIRLMPALLGVLGVVVIFITAHQLFSRRAAWWSAAVLASNPLYFLSSQYADMNIEIAVWVTCALCCFLLGRQLSQGTKGRRTLFALAWLAVALGILTKGFIGIVFPAMIIGIWVLIGRRWRELPQWYFASGIALVLIVCLPWFVAVQRTNPQFFQHFFVYQQFERFTNSGFNNVWPFWFYLPIIALGFLPWSIWLPACLRDQLRLTRNNRRATDMDSRQLLLLWPLLILIFFSIPSSKIVGYIVPVLPPLSLLLGDFLARRFSNTDFFTEKKLSEKNRERQFFHAFLFISVVINLSVIIAAVHFDRTGALELAKTLNAEMKATDEFIGYRYYAQDIPLYLKLTAPIAVVDDWSDSNILQEDSWRREFYLGLQYQPEAKNQLIDESEFERRLRERKFNQRIFVLARNRDAQRLIEKFGLLELQRSRKQVLLVTTTG